MSAHANNSETQLIWLYTQAPFYSYAQSTDNGDNWEDSEYGVAGAGAIWAEQIYLNNNGDVNFDFVVNVENRLTSADRDTLYDSRINPIAVFPRAGFVIFGQKTLQMTKSALDRVNVRRLMIEVKRQIVRVADKLLFEPNNSQTRARFVSQVTPLLALIQAQAGVEQFKKKGK
mgnify:CR=1 FL=1